MLRGITIAVSEEEFNQPLELGDFENREVMMTKTTLSIDSEYTRYNNGHEESFQALNFFRDESMGTVKLFTMLPYLYDTLENGGVLILDEIENGLHLSLAKDVVRLFLDEESNPHNAQLICTTHQPLLVDTNMNIRRDQVWVISKDSIGRSSLNRLSELSTSRAKVNLTNKILENAFGCNPEPFF
jgi:AAA15 family ATPase/GTPase